MKLNIALLTLLILFYQRAYSSQYSIQLDNTKKPSLEHYEVLNIYGALYTVSDRSGYTQIRLGPYADKQIALDALHEVRVAGYKQSYLMKHQFLKTVITDYTAKQRFDFNSIDIKTILDTKTLNIWNNLTPVQQSNLVYREGKLQIRNGNKLTPLDYDLIKQ